MVAPLTIGLFSPVRGVETRADLDVRISSLQLSTANSYRSVDGVIYVLVAQAGDDEGLWSPADNVVEITRLGVVRPSGEISLVPFVTADAEVSDAMIDYKDLDRDQVNARLAELNIRVRPAVTAPSTGTP